VRAGSYSIRVDQQWRICFSGRRRDPRMWAGYDGDVAAGTRRRTERSARAFRQPIPTGGAAISAWFAHRAVSPVANGCAGLVGYAGGVLARKSVRSFQSARTGYTAIARVMTSRIAPNSL